ncbi:hypothetical protein N480_14715 [Pseudoalteromonas luteoviolacea S2607]|uniref:cytochrome c n=1 Tax=Pseudoalteromonas luteoviolacea TaxID=43657 RepID=UPI0007B0ABD5|nr:cytochrome c [Pseudoalteromonas luteoviolacea]KZN37993.1 hypothetical protein N480_14715 [Pseudoalteromonas luteoviolacea S2607]
MVKFTRWLIALPLLASANSVNTAVESRQNAFEAIESLVDEAEDLLDAREIKWQKLLAVSAQLNAQGDIVLNAFPRGSHQNSRAKPRIWEKWGHFEGMMSQMDQGFKLLHKGSETQNTRLALQGLEAAADTCRSCHRSYRSFW